MILKQNINGGFKYPLVMQEDKLKFRLPGDNDNNEEYTTPVFNFLMNHLKELSKKSTEPYKVYFSGEFDSNQTVFEKLSNNLQIGVIANNETTGLILLHFLRMIIDQHPDLFFWNLQDKIGYDITEYEMSIDEIVALFARFEEQYMSSFDLNDIFVVKLRSWSKEITIEHTINDVNIWTLERINKEFPNIF